MAVQTCASRLSFVVAAALLFLCSDPATAQPAHRDITYILPMWSEFTSATPEALQTEIGELRTRIGEGPYVKVGFSAYINVSMTDWAVDASSPAAVQTALASTFAQIDSRVTLASAQHVPICLNILTAIREGYDPVQMASEVEDRRSMQWFADNSLANGWWTYSRYARKARGVQEAYVRELGRYLAKVMSQNADTLVAATGDGEIELAFSTSNAARLADYSPFAIAEFKDWLTHAGMYADGIGELAGQGYSLGARYAGDDSPAADTNGDGHTLNGDFGTSFTSWTLRYADASDGNPIPATTYTQPGWAPVDNEAAVPGAKLFDAPRTRTPGNAWWEVWSLFRQMMVWHYNVDFAKWITTTPWDDPGTAAVENLLVSAERWYSYQIPADYLFGGTPQNPNDRFTTSASPLWSADIAPYGGLGITAFNVNWGASQTPPADGPYSKTLAGAAPAIETRHVRWGILEWNPSVPVSSGLEVYRDEMKLIERYRPTLLIPFLWPGASEYLTKATGFETAMKELVGRIGNVPASCTFSIPSSVTVEATGGEASFTVTASAADCPWTVTPGASWITILSGASGTGTGIVRYRVEPHTGAARSTTFTVAARETAVTQAAPPITITFPSRLAAGPDYATDVLKDPWDMSNAEDVSPEPTETAGFTNFAVSGGLAGGTIATLDAGVSFLFRGFYTIVNPGKNGVNFPIDTSKYQKLAVRLSDSGTGENPQVYWFHYSWGDPAITDPTGQALGVRFLPPTSNGFHILMADMTQANDPNYLPWTDGSVRGFRIDPNSDHSGQSMFFDWIRLTYGDSIPGAAMQTIQWSGGSGTATITVTDSGGTVYNVASGVSGGTYNWNYGILPPGTYTLQITTTDGTTASQSFTINNPPSIAVTDPSRTSGDDFATTVLGDAWDMSSVSDIESYENITGLSASGGQVQATNTNGDPAVVPLYNNGNSTRNIDTSKYRYFTYKFQVDGAYDLANGSVARVFWTSAPFIDGATATTTKDIIVFPGMNTYTVDLAALTTASGGGLETSGSAEAWTAANKTNLRFDPHEFAAARTFHIDDVKLTANPVSYSGSFTIRFSGSDADAGDSPTVSLYYDTDQNATNGKTLIASGVALSAGSYVWTTSGVPFGTYYIYAEASDGVNTAGSYGDAPIVLTSPPCTYSLSATSAAAAYAGTNGTVTVTVSAPGCAWTAASNASFITVTSGASGSDSGTVAYTVTRNPGRAARIGTLTIAGQTFTVTQAGAATPGDLTGDGHADTAVYHPGTGIWSVSGLADRQWGLPGDIPVPGDYNGDQVLDTAVYRPWTGEWFIYGQTTVQWGLPGDLPVPADYNGDGTTDQAIYRTIDGTYASWYVRGQFVRSWGMRGDVPVPADFDGDGSADLAVYRPSTGAWFITYSSTGFATYGAFQFGLVGDVPVPGDYNGDRKADLAVFRPSTGTWYLALSSTSGVTFTDATPVAWGRPGDIPFAGDFDGDGVDEQAIFRPADGTWSLYNRVTLNGTVLQYGGSGDIPVLQRPQLPSQRSGDIDGDLRADVTVFRPSTGDWYTLTSTTDYQIAAYHQWGLSGDIKVPADYDGDHQMDLAVWRPSSGMWYLLFSKTAFGTSRAEQWGLPDDVPVPADYDGDGRTDLAVWRPSTGEWFVRYSASDYTGVSVDQWGLSGDVPMPADYDGDGRADLAVYRPSTGMWYLRLSSGAFGGVIVTQWGLSSDVPIAVDFDGDGRADLTVYRPSTGEWLGIDWLINAWVINKQWGLSGDTPVPHDYDGDGISDTAVFRPSTAEWYIKPSSVPAGSGAYRYLRWGLSTDQPVGSIEGEPPR